MSSITDTVEGGARPEKLKKELERIEHDLWDYLDDQNQYLLSDDIPKEEEDIHYLEGKREGFEEALMAFYNVENVEKIYEKEPDNSS